MNARIEKYLVAYNLVQLTGWLAAIIVLPFNLLYSFWIILFCQIFSLLEIFHAYKKWTNSSPFLCFIQTGARLMILYFSIIILCSIYLQPLNFFFTKHRAESIIYLMFASWCVAEIIRYTYYSTELLNQKLKGIVWLRYNAFILCYPVGLICEIYIIVNLFVITSLYVKIFLILVLIAYMFLFPRLYLHLLKQRKLKLNSNNK
ncbi:MAG: hypothetical protein KA174_00355 [Chitinophagales bacterium]|nr:hypothetical protein [Chitinophagales bacterium]